HPGPPVDSDGTGNTKDQNRDDALENHGSTRPFVFPANIMVPYFPAIRHRVPDVVRWNRVKLGRLALKGGNPMERLLIVGGDPGGAALLRALDQMDRVKVVGVVASDPRAPAFVEAQNRGIPVGTDPEPFIHPLPDVIIQLSEQPDLADLLPVRGDGKKPLLIV